MEKQMVENSNNTVAMNAYRNACLIAMLHPLQLSINSMKAIVEELQDQNKVHEAGICSAFLGYMVGVHSFAIETRSYIFYSDKALPPEISTIDLIGGQINRCSTMQKAYVPHPKQGITVNYEQIRHKLEALKDLLKIEQPDRTAILNVIFELIQVTVQAYNQLMNDLSLKPKNWWITEEEVTESVSDKQ